VLRAAASTGGGVVIGRRFFAKKKIGRRCRKGTKRERAALAERPVLGRAKLGYAGWKI
jgi:hypothetical protein